MESFKVVILANMWGHTVSLADIHTGAQIGSLVIVSLYTLYKFYSEYKRNNEK